MSLEDLADEDEEVEEMDEQGSDEDNDPIDIDDDEDVSKSKHVFWPESDKNSLRFSPNEVHFLPQWIDTNSLGYYLRHPEYVVYKENQVRIRYIVQLKQI